MFEISNRAGITRFEEGKGCLVFAFFSLKDFVFYSYNLVLHVYFVCVVISFILC